MNTIYYTFRGWICIELNVNLLFEKLVLETALYYMHSCARLFVNYE